MDELGWMTLRASNGGDVPYIGYFTIDMDLGDVVVPDRGVLVTRVEKDVPMLLGMNVLQELPVDVLAKQVEGF